MGRRQSLVLISHFLAVIKRAGNCGRSRIVEFHLGSSQRLPVSNVPHREKRTLMPSRLHYDVGIAFFQLLRGTFMVALTVILASGVVIWRQFTRAGQRDLVRLHWLGQLFEKVEYSAQPTIVATSIGVPLLFAGWVVVLLFGYGMRIYEGTGFAVVMLYSIFSLVFYACVYGDSNSFHGSHYLAAYSSSSASNDRFGRRRHKASTAAMA